MVAASAAVVALALVGFVVTGERDADVSASPAGTHASAPPPGDPPAGRQHEARAGSHSGHRQHGGASSHRHADAQPVERRTAYVEVYNNTAVTGLAADTSAALLDDGWRVVATDNWHGDIPADTVYFPPQLKAQAQLLAHDLGVSRLHAAVAPMSFDRITVILVAAP